MNVVHRRNPDLEELARIREIVGGRQLPEFINGFDVQLGDFGGSPAVWITLRLAGNEDVEWSELKRRGEMLLPLQEKLHDDILDAGIERFPFFRIASTHSP